MPPDRTLRGLAEYCRRHATMLRRTAQTERERIREGQMTDGMTRLFLRDAEGHEANAAHWQGWADALERLLALQCGHGTITVENDEAA